MRVCHFGFLANRVRAERLLEIREAIAESEDLAGKEAPVAEGSGPKPFDGYPCPKCRQGHLRIVGHLAPQRDEGG